MLIDNDGLISAKGRIASKPTLKHVTGQYARMICAMNVCEIHRKQIEEDV